MPVRNGGTADVAGHPTALRPVITPTYITLAGLSSPIMPAAAFIQTRRSADTTAIPTAQRLRGIVRRARQKLVREPRADQEDEGEKNIAQCPMPPLSLDAIAYERQDERYQE